MKNWKDNVSFILVEPRESGNIGASARAIKNMGFKNLCTVGRPSDMDDAVTFAHNAMDVLESSQVFDSFEDAVRDKDLVAGTTRRRGRKRGVFTSVEDGARRLYEAASVNRVAVLFGREDRGLYNEEIDECGFLMTIPANKEQPSLNISQAVMIMAYELSKAEFREPDTPGKDEQLITASAPKYVNQKELAVLYERMEKALKLIEYIPPDNDYLNKKIMQNMKHFLGRAGLTDWEYNMFHGICKYIEKVVKEGKDRASAEERKS